MSPLSTFFARVEGSAKGLINPEELFRSIVTALGSGTFVGLLILLLQAVLTHIATILPDPTVASLASMVLTLVLDLLRRQNQSGKPVVTPVVTPAANPAVTPAATTVPATPAPVR